MVSLPVLRDRESDIELLIEFFRKTANQELGKDITRIAPEAIAKLKEYSWPGNVRQLQSVVHQAIVQSSGSVLLADFIPQLKSRGSNEQTTTTQTNSLSPSQEPATEEPDAETTDQNDATISESVADLIQRHCLHHSATLYDNVIEEVERELIATILNGCGGNLTEAAKQLGITRTTVRSKVNKLGIGIRKVVE